MIIQKVLSRGLLISFEIMLEARSLLLVLVYRDMQVNQKTLQIQLPGKKGGAIIPVTVILLIKF